MPVDCPVWGGHSGVKPVAANAAERQVMLNFRALWIPNYGGISARFDSPSIREGIKGLVYPWEMGTVDYYRRNYTPSLFPPGTFPKLFNRQGNFRRKVRREAARVIRARARAAGMKEGKDYIITF